MNSYFFPCFSSTKHSSGCLNEMTHESHEGNVQKVSPNLSVPKTVVSSENQRISIHFA